jgi:hypothetical protein
MKRLLLSCLVACSTPAPHARFANQPPVTAVDDRRDVRETPKQRRFAPTLYYFDSMFHRGITRRFELPEKKRAQGVNAMDEVPNSTWFTNRIGVRDVSIEEMRNGPATIESPELHTPWTIIRMKPGGTAPGFVIRDARGEKFLLKPDLLGYPETESAADVIAQRILWAAGYNVPENHVVYFAPGEIILGKGVDPRDFQHRIAKCDPGTNGRMRGLDRRAR